MADEEAGGSISYSIRELLDGIKTSIDRLYGKLDTKADKSDVVELSRRVGHESKRIDSLETLRSVDVESRTQEREWKKWLIPALLTLAMLAVSVIQLLRPSH